LRKLSEEANNVTKELQAKLADAQVVAAAINSPVPILRGIDKAILDAPVVKGFVVKGQQTGPEEKK
jgi:hypothetical protein